MQIAALHSHSVTTTVCITCVLWVKNVANMVSRTPECNIQANTGKIASEKSIADHGVVSISGIGHSQHSNARKMFIRSQLLLLLTNQLLSN